MAVLYVIPLQKVNTQNQYLITISLISREDFSYKSLSHFLFRHVDIYGDVRAIKYVSE